MLPVSCVCQSISACVSLSRYVLSGVLEARTIGDTVPLESHELQGGRGIVTTSLTHSLVPSHSLNHSFPSDAESTCKLEYYTQGYFYSCPSLRVESTIGYMYSYPLCGIFYFPWLRHQIEGTDGF